MIVIRDYRRFWIRGRAYLPCGHFLGPLAASDTEAARLPGTVGAVPHVCPISARL